MSFWQTSEGKTVTNDSVTTKFETSNFDPIPRGTIVTAVGLEARWKEYDGKEHIGIDWVVAYGDYKNKHIFQNIYVLDEDAKRRDKALTMLATVDKLTGNKLLSLYEKPTDMDLMSVCGKPIDLRIGVYKERNFVEAVGAIGELGKSEQKPESQKTQQTNANKTTIDFDDDIPF